LIHRSVGEVGVQAKELANRILLAVFQSADPEATGTVDCPVVEAAHPPCRRTRDEPSLAGLDIDPVPAASQRADDRVGSRGQREAADVLAELDPLPRRCARRKHVDGTFHDVDPEQTAVAVIPERTFAERRLVLAGELDHRTAPTRHGAISSAPKPRSSTCSLGYLHAPTTQGGTHGNN
jgi:hypothetical protein